MQNSSKNCSKKNVRPERLLSPLNGDSPADDRPVILPNGGPETFRKNFPKNNSASCFGNKKSNFKKSPSPAQNPSSHQKPAAADSTPSAAQKYAKNRRFFNPVVVRPPPAVRKEPPGGGSSKENEKPKDAPAPQIKKSRPGSFVDKSPFLTLQKKKSKIFYKSAEFLEKQEIFGPGAASEKNSKSRRRSSSVPGLNCAKTFCGQKVPIKIAVRIKPPKFEKFENDVTKITSKVDNYFVSESNGALTADQNGNVTVCGVDQTYKFNFGQVFCEEKGAGPTWQKIVYEKTARSLVDTFLDGYNCCLLTYGPTGSGKTYSMMGEKHCPGIVPRFCADIIDASKNVFDATDSLLQVSYYELYNEKLVDLLCDEEEALQSQLRVREHVETGPYVDGLKLVMAKSLQDIEKSLEFGNKRRATAATWKNEKSSRSHAIFTLKLTQFKEPNLRAKVSCMCFVDLAGSEKAIGVNSWKETTSINKSLCFLGKVILQLGDKNRQHVSYRDSVLTWLLKEYLGGNAHTRILITVKPEEEALEETLSTLRFASQAKAVVCKAVANEDLAVVIAKRYKTEVAELNKKLVVEAELLQKFLVVDSELLQKRAEIAEVSKNVQILEEKLKLSEETQNKEKCMATQMIDRERAWIISAGLLRCDILNLVVGQPYAVLLTDRTSDFQNAIFGFASKPQLTVGPGISCDVQINEGALAPSTYCSLKLHEDGRLFLHCKICSISSTEICEKIRINGRIVQDESVLLSENDRLEINGQNFLLVWIPKHERDFFNYSAEYHRAVLDSVTREMNGKDLQLKVDELNAELRTAQLEVSCKKNHVTSEAAELKEFFAEKIGNVESILLSAKSTAETPSTCRSSVRKKTVEHLDELDEYSPSKIFKSNLLDEMNNLFQKYGTAEFEKRPSFKRSSSLLLSSLIEEANSFLNQWPKQFEFSQEETYDESNGLFTLLVRLTNTKLKMFALLPVRTFQHKLEAMRCLYESGGINGDHLDDVLMNAKDDWQPMLDGETNLFSVAL